MRKCQKCERKFDDDEVVDCDELACPLKMPDAVPPTLVKSKASREQMVQLAMDAIGRGELDAMFEDASDEAGSASDEGAPLDSKSESPKKPAKPKKPGKPKIPSKPKKKLAPPSGAKKPPPPPKRPKGGASDDGSKPTKSSEDGGEKPKTKAAPKLSLSDLRSKLKKAKGKKQSVGKVEAPDDGAVSEDPTVLQTDFDVSKVPIPDSIHDDPVELEVEPVEEEVPEVDLEVEPVDGEDVPEVGLEPLAADAAADPTVLETDFDINAVPIPDSIDDELEPADTDIDGTSDEVASPLDSALLEALGEPGDRTVEAPKPDLEAIREAAAKAAAEIAAERGGTGDAPAVEQAPPAASLFDLESGDLPDIDGADVDPAVLLAEDPNFGLPPYEVIEYHEGYEAPEVSGEGTPEPNVTTSYAGAVDWLPEETSGEKLEIEDVVDLDAWRDLVVLVVSLLGCISVLYLAVTSWWSWETVFYSTFGVVLPTCGVIGLLFLTAERRDEWKRILFRSAGMGGAFAMLVTAVWWSGDARALAFDWVGEKRNTVYVQRAFGDPSAEVATLACRELAARPQQHAWIVSELDSRPEIATPCMSEIEADEHRIALNRLSELWRSRLLATDAGGENCSYVDHYAELPLEEDQKFFDFFTCAFSGSDEMQRCCGDAVKQHFGGGEDLVPPMQLVALERLSRASMDYLVGPVLRQAKYEGERRRNADALELDNRELQRNAFEMACLMTGSTEAVGAALEYLSAYGSEGCSRGGDEEYVTESLEDWRQICRLVIADATASLPMEDQVCIGIQKRHVAIAAAEASILVHAAITRFGSRALEERIESGTALEMAEKEANRDELIESQTLSDIDSLYNVQSKQNSLAALDALAKEEAKDAARTEKITERWESARMQDALKRRKNILRMLMKTDKSWQQKVKDSGR